MYQLIEKYNEAMAISTGFQGKYTNHSLRVTSATRLYESGYPEKLIKELTGHCSNAVQEHQCTPNTLKRAVSAALGKSPEETEPKLSKVEVSCESKAMECKDEKSAHSLTQCIQSVMRNAIASHVDGKHIKKPSVQVNFEFEEE